MKRTVKRYSRKINDGKWQQLCHIARLYRDEKNFHLKYYNQDVNFAGDKDERVFRDILVGQKYKSATKLQARHWKIAQKKAYETVEKNWCALSVELKPMIAKHKGIWSDSEMHYAYWLVYSDKRLANLISEVAPEPENFELSFGEKKRVRNYLRRIVRRKRWNRPVAKLTRSFTLDENMYSVVERVDGNQKKKQFLEIMSLIPRKRIVLPLTGCTNISGNITIVLDFYKQRAEVHVTSALDPQKIDSKKPVIALDAGISEVFMDETGKAYESTFGNTLSIVSKQLNKTGKYRNAAYVLRNKSSKHKAHRIQKFNLGKEKLRDRKNKAKIRIEQQISHAIHQVVEVYQPSIIITEGLDIRGKAKSKGMSRLVSYWMRGSLKERFDFMALVERFHHEQVNPAYTS
jgi:putative transposase